jgi:hypothetical protein
MGVDPICQVKRKKDSKNSNATSNISFLSGIGGILPDYFWRKHQDFLV